MKPDYDFNEPLIRDMVRRHWPKELVKKTISGQVVVHIIQCDTCYDKWPCAPVLALREWIKEQRELEFARRVEAAKRDI